MSSQDSNPDAETIQDCTECGAIATTEILGDDDRSYCFCGVCDAHFRESLAELEAQRGAMCDDHLKKGSFLLCGHCFAWADHEDDYLDFCDCILPVGDPVDTECRSCWRALRAVSTYCDCPTPAVTGACRITCVECHERIRPS